MNRLGPGDVPNSRGPTRIVGNAETGFVDDNGSPVDPQYLPQVPEQVVKEMTDGLAKLRAPFPPEMIEKLPKPMWRGAWDDKNGAQCNICHGRHVLDDAIHLDYVGHANTTNRLLEVDPFWEWEPMAYTETGLPLFDKVGGLWIRLTICGVTRLGYGDGANPKEIIGDAIRNAAMRFGVALDLWSKIDLHAERNPGDGQTQTQRPARQSDEVHRGGSGDTQSAGETPADQSPAPNQEALDSLGSVCDDNGFDRRTMREEYAQWAATKRYRDRDLLTAHRDRIYKFAEHLLEGADPDPGVDGSGRGEAGEAAGEGDDGVGTAAPGEAGLELPDSSAEPAAAADAEPVDRGDDYDAGRPPTDTSDVEKKPGEIF